MNGELRGRKKTTQTSLQNTSPYRVEEVKKATKLSVNKKQVTRGISETGTPVARVHKVLDFREKENKASTLKLTTLHDKQNST
jgi:hypothetical protein